MEQRLLFALIIFLKIGASGNFFKCNTRLLEITRSELNKKKLKISAFVSSQLHFLE